MRTQRSSFLGILSGSQSAQYIANLTGRTFGRLRIAGALLRVYAGSAPRFAPNAATYFQALRWVAGPVTTVVVVEEADGPVLRAALESYRPATVVARREPGDPDIATLPDAVRAMLTGDSPRAYVCVGTSCAPPVSSPEELRALLGSFAG